MEDSTIFKSPIVEVNSEVEKPLDPIVERKKTPGDANISESELTPDLMKTPYVIEILEMGEAYKQFDMPELVGEINDFILEELGDNITKQAYKDKFDEIYKKAEVKVKDVYAVIERLNEYCRLQNKIKQIIKEKEEFEAMPIEEMTSKQLKRKLNGNRT